MSVRQQNLDLPQSGSLAVFGTFAKVGGSLATVGLWIFAINSLESAVILCHCCMRDFIASTRTGWQPLAGFKPRCFRVRHVAQPLCRFVTEGGQDAEIVSRASLSTPAGLPLGKSSRDTRNLPL